MKKKGCCSISFDKGHVDIRWEGREAFDLLDFLFKESLQSSDDRTLALFTLKAEKPHPLLLHQRKKLLCKGEAGKVAVRLLDRIIFELAKETKGGLLFHAAALSRNGRSILIPGQSGSGKTFLAASFADNGYTYITDEMTLVESENFYLYGFYKPLHIKNPIAFKHQSALKTSCRNQPNPGCVNLPVNKGFLTNCFFVNPEKRQQSTKAALIIFPKYESGIEFSVRRLPCAKTGLLLMQSLINARNLTSHGFHEISMLSREVPAYIMTYGKSSHVVQAVDSLWAF
ncbi:hypothetical protein ACFL27_06170 [candidate division CSSED10-310 bacterium]|uniref:HPr kinase/phosphorylase C-terminal domain-containing protein n=1 Tax=candidate division CSSED10-310 bacterium TaxID=2855610 RepID=A0ABV6YUA4_UNCC1